jgi:hypothetical protein
MSIRVTSGLIRSTAASLRSEYAVSRFSVERCGSLGGGCGDAAQSGGKKLIEEMDLATGVLGLGFF